MTGLQRLGVGALVVMAVAILTGARSWALAQPPPAFQAWSWAIGLLTGVVMAWSATRLSSPISLTSAGAGRDDR